MINDEVDEILKELFESLKNRYQNNLELMKGSEFVFNYLHLLYYKCQKIKSELWWIIYRFSLLDRKKSKNKSYQ